MSRILQAYLESEEAIRKYIARFNACSEEADDIAQEAFLRGFAAERLTDIREPRAFLFRIAKNLALGEQRRNRRAQTDNIEDFGGAGIVVDERQALAEDQLDSHRKLAALAMAVARLTPQCREVFLMARVEGLRHKQIAYRLNMTVSNVEKRVAKGILECSRYLREQGYEPSEFGKSMTRKNGVVSRKNANEGGRNDR